MIDRKDATWRRAAEKFATALLAAKPAVAELKKAREKIIRLAGQESAQGFGVIAERKRRAGSVNYADIPELQGVDLAAFRKADTFYFELGLVDE